MGKGPLEWTDALLTGDPVIDTHHKTFFLKALRVFVACKLGRGADHVAETLAFMRDYAIFHFAEEEARMRAVGYPYVETHAEAHGSFLAQLERLERDFAAAEDKHTVAKASAELAIRWFTQHITSVDRPLVEYLRQTEEPA